MPFHLVFLSALMLGCEASPGPPCEPPADPVFPLPLYKSPPVTGLFISGGSLSSPGVGWDFSDGSSLRGTTYCMPVFENTNFLNCWHLYAHLGTTTGLSGDWYLGRGVQCQLKLALPVLESRIGIDWYPIEGLTIGVGLNPLNRQLQLGWHLIDREAFASLQSQH